MFKKFILINHIGKFDPERFLSSINNNNNNKNVWRWSKDMSRSEG